MHLFHPEWEMEHSGFDRNVHKEPPYASTNLCNVLSHPQRSINITFKPTTQFKIVLSKDVQAGGNILWNIKSPSFNRLVGISKILEDYQQWIS